jgi:sigma-B regulation protein RsbU (phosphoserine phosphatase)
VCSAITLLIVGAVIATLGAAAVTVYAFRRRAHEKFLLWFGLFSILYGVVLIVRNSAFRLGFGQPEGVELSVERLISLSTSVPGLLLFEEFYGRGWRSSIRWLIGSYCALAAVAITAVLHQSHLELIPSPGTVLAIMVALVLTLGRLAGYSPPCCRTVESYLQDCLHSSAHFHSTVCFILESVLGTPGPNHTDSWPL